jgi:hypothetical protein
MLWTWTSCVCFACVTPCTRCDSLLDLEFAIPTGPGDADDGDDTATPRPALPVVMPGPAGLRAAMDASSAVCEAIAATVCWHAGLCSPPCLCARAQGQVPFHVCACARVFCGHAQHAVCVCVCVCVRACACVSALGPHRSPAPSAPCARVAPGRRTPSAAPPPWSGYSPKLGALSTSSTPLSLAPWLRRHPSRVRAPGAVA